MGIGLGMGFGTWFLVLYRQQRKPLMPFIAVTAFTGAGIYLGPGISFLSLLVTGENISGLLYAYLSYTSPPVATVCGIYVGFSIFDPDHKNQVTGLYSVIAAVFLGLLFALPDAMIEVSTGSPGELLDVTMQSVALVLMGFFIFSLIFLLGGGFYRLSRKMTGTTERKHAQFLTAGWILFAVAGIMDAMVPPTLFQLMVVARGMMAVAFVLIFRGFSPPKTGTPEL